jgi:hypothetical protein
MKLTIQEKINGVLISETKNVVTVSGVGIQGASIIPSGGAEHMILVKKSALDYDMEWTNQPDELVIDANMNGGYF